MAIDVTPYLDGLPELQQRQHRTRERLQQLLARLNRQTNDGWLDQFPTVITSGHWRDIKTYQDGRVEVTPWDHNLVVNNAAVLAGALFLGNGAGGLGAVYKGIEYMAVGTGLSGWDSPNPGDATPAPTLGDTQLLTELARKLVQVQFVDGGGAVITGPSSTILVTCTFNIGEANGILREWALFGGNATGSANSGIMFDRVNQAGIPKLSGGGDFSLTRLVTIIF